MQDFLSYSTDMPTGSGLGTSGAGRNVGFITTISSQSQSMLETAEIAYQFEALLGNKVVARSMGKCLRGINHLTFTDDNVSVKSIEVSTEFSDWLEQHLLLFSSHIAHVSGDLHKSVWQRYTNGDVEIINGLDIIRDAGL